MKLLVRAAWSGRQLASPLSPRVSPCNNQIHLKIREPAAMATTVHHTHSPDPTPTPPPAPAQDPPVSGDAAAEPAAEGGGGEIAALDEQLAVAVAGGGGGGGGDGPRKEAAGGGGKLVAEAMRKYAAPRSSRYHGVTRLARRELGKP